MRSRVISAIIAIPIGIGLLIAGGRIFDAGIFILSAIALFEFYNAIERAGYKPVKPVGALYVLFLLSAVIFGIRQPMSIYIDKLTDQNLFPLLQIAIILFLLCAIVVGHNKYNIIDAAITIFGGYYAVILFSYFILLENMKDGVFYLIIAVLGSIAADTCAFFVGINFGKRKLIPEVSPKKTVAGSVGAIVGTVIVMLIYGLILNSLNIAEELAIIHYVILGFIIGIAAQFGDLCASAIKRTVGIKDFGRIMPGHGGILDRFDSYIFVAPIVYYYINFAI